MELGLKRGMVAVEPHDPQWEVTAAQTIEQLKSLLQGVAIDIQHIGSTAIRSIAAKPIIDIVVGVKDIDEILELNPELEAKGFIFRGQDLPDQYLYVCGDADSRTHHIHVVLHDSIYWNNYVNMRDYLNCHGEDARAYSKLKERLAKEYPEDRITYTEKKRALIDEILRKAMEWRGTQMNYFVEGLQGSGKSTLVRKLTEKHPAYQVFREGDYNPVELAWCAYVSEKQYEAYLEKYQAIRQEIETKSYKEGDRRIICYTQIMTDTPGFYKDLEQYEIYNNRVSKEDFKRIIFDRFRNWSGDGQIFECSIFQNIVEDMILYQNASDQEILEFYRELGKLLADKQLHILYLESEDVAGNINVIRKERSDAEGNEMWFPLMLGYFNESPFAKAHGVSGEDAMIGHFIHRQELELKICREIFPGRYTVLKSKNYGDDKLV